MQTGLQAEVLLCPNCKEEVPKTLYCLNCGYPLYKIEVDQPEVEEDVEVVVDEAPEPVEEPVVEAETIEEVVVMVEELAAQSTSEEAEAEIGDSEPTEAVVPVEITEFVAEEEAEPEVEAVPVVIEDEPVDEVVEPAEEEVLEVSLEEPAESVEASVFEVVEGPEIEDVEMVEESVPVDDVLAELVPSYDPDPGIMEVMENFGKNISMKIRLVGLLGDGGVKPEIFERLFESYEARGELLMDSRSKMLERVRFDLESMEGSLELARAGLEELEIRRAISDVSEEEYAAKSPGYEWDIDKYGDEVGRRRSEIAFLEDIARVMAGGEIGELIVLGEGCLGILESLVESGKLGSEVAARVRASLEEALSCLRA